MHFRDKYAFLSNFAPSDIRMSGMVFPTVEHVFQAAKTLDLAERQQIAACKTPAEAKRLGRRVSLRSDWEDIKVNVMREALRRKFAREPYRSQLLAVQGDIVEDNTWGDTFWGVCRGRGKNVLGQLLMEIRAELA